MTAPFADRLRGGIRPDTHKRESGAAPLVALPMPPELVIPLAQHKGPPAEADVRAGDRVRACEAVGRAAHPDSLAVHSPASGVVRAVELRAVVHTDGEHKRQMCIVIETDGDAAAPRAPAPDWRDCSVDEIAARLRQSGVAGLGGAAFPSHRKLPLAGIPVHTVVINAAECEPYITCDEALMRHRPDEIVRGALVLSRLMGGAAPLLALEDDKPEAAASVEAAARGTAVRIAIVPARYPVGAAHLLVYALTGIEIPAGRHAAEYGVQCFNVATACAIHRALDLGEPLARRVVTIAGRVARPQNVEAPIGTPLSVLLDHAGRLAGRMSYSVGGPLMGCPVDTLEAPVVKSTNCLLTLPTPERAERVMPCIRCARCADACPVGLQPHDLWRFCRAGRTAKASEYGLAACIECGACDYVCPSRIPLVAQFRVGKASIAQEARSAAAAARSRERFEAHEKRVARAESDALEPLEGADDRVVQDAVRAALERARRPN